MAQWRRYWRPWSRRVVVHQWCTEAESELTFGETLSSACHLRAQRENGFISLWDLHEALEAIMGARPSGESTITRSGRLLIMTLFVSAG